MKSTATGRNKSKTHSTQSSRLNTDTAQELPPIAKQFVELELALIQQNRLQNVIDLLLVNLKSRLNLTEVNLILFDPEHAARSLLESSQWLKPCFQLKFVMNHSLLSELYPHKTATFSSKSPQQDSLLMPQLFETPSHLEDYALIPLVHEDFVIGSLHLGSDSNSLLNNTCVRECLDHYAQFVAISLANCITQENLKRLSIIDVLTKVNNRRSFNQELTKEVSRAFRGQYSLSCIFLDIDYFKIVNDKYGHPSGDRVLRTIGQFLKQHVRKTDLVARYGGEEFAILLPDCNEDKLRVIAKQLRSRFNTMIFRTEEGQAFKLTASMGISTYNAQPNDLEILGDIGMQLVSAADKATYHSKNTGRDKVSFRVMNPSRHTDSELKSQEFGQ